ncbi:type IA DNA topoisomerase [Helicobacter pylori]|uniref:type IA DNA topoisomerase n=1 Tax=Helicobacter pylori TaxID=210 RepID=UPI001931A9DA|nr:type IA DNA topoisomerase [Helicobacter pylori]MBM0604571.1 type IA DNA topoisomerase [Helicobacter pylori]MBM0615037.1 type IA DNA topoisomerase [Helicobacter pylori]MBM0615766.1 type IA DNA topoisomerase [Helicobacter pylori]MBM0617299.1 type IA DNA topoisomerase [Helicobacter pylori]MBM0629786.1 type IA DNA topoisomerase [Helicobacter pylori]
MNNSVIIIESPNKVAKIREITGAKVFATIGHFMQLKSYDESNGFKPTFDYDQEKKKHIFEMIEACKNKKVYIATDPDREGYAIGYMFYQKIKNVASSIYRAEFFEITPSGINKGLQNASLFENTNKQMYQSALARRVADMLLGFTLSPYLGKALGQMKGSSVGRVQTPCLKLIVDRDREIEKFKALPENEKVSYQIQAKINDSANREVTIKHCDEKGEEIKFNDKEEALKLFESLKDNKACLLKDLKNSVVETKPKKPFITSTLLEKASSMLGLSISEVQSLAQNLFEAGLITYIRTDAESLSVEFLDETESFYAPIYKDLYLKREYKAGKQSQAEAHEAIRITHPHTTEDLESIVYNANITNQDALKLYQLIFERTIESQGKNAIYDKQDLLFKIKNEYFKCSVKGLKSAGFLAMFSKKELENDESNDDKDNKEKEQNAQFNLKIDDVLSLNDLVLATIKRNAPSAYKEADFVKLLENKGIGRPSTYASYLPMLVKREYISISQDKKHIITPTHKGKRVVEVFENAYQFIIDLTYTKQMEEMLDEIVENKSSYVDFISNLNSKCPKIEKLERNDDEIKPSSEGQITYIENILRDLQLNLSEEFKNYKEDNRVAKAFLDRYIKEHEFFKKNNKKASSSNNDENRPATPKQISFAEMLAKKHNVKLPKGFKYSMKVCGDFINEYHKK